MTKAADKGKSKPIFIHCVSFCSHQPRSSMESPVRPGLRPRPSRRPPWILHLLPVFLFVAGVLLLYSNDASINVTTNLHTSVLRLGKHRPEVDPPSFIPYQTLYVQLPPALGIALLVLWLVFLFSFLGIVASDFFCPNLSTLASRLGLPEDVAGATMVGWANGAPDLFSTFASLKAGSGSLAVGELIGAASFICSVVAGSMVLVKPFKVGKYNFFRDVGFFTVAVAFALGILRDGHIHKWEAQIMIALYATYVMLVAGGSWWRRRRWRARERERLIRDAWRIENTENEHPEHYTDEVDAPLLLENGHSLPSSKPKPKTSRRATPTNFLTPLIIPSVRISGESEQEDYFGNNMPPLTRGESPNRSPLLTPVLSAGGRRRSGSLVALPSNSSGTHQHRHSRTHSQHLVIPSPGRILHRSSILAAIEFRDVVNSLQAESHVARQLGAFQESSNTKRPNSSHGRQRKIRSTNSNKSGSTKTDLSNSQTPSPASSAYRQRPRALSNPNPRTDGQPYFSGENGSDTFSPLAVDDPWKNAPATDSLMNIPDPDCDHIHEPVPEWNLDASITTSSPENPNVDMETEESVAGESDVTARPPKLSKQGAHTNINASGSTGAGPAMSRFPLKALRFLGLAPSPHASMTSAVPAKAQRLLGLNAHTLTPTTSTSKKPSQWRKILPGLAAIIHAVFPSLHHFRTKSFLAKITSVISVPAILLLNVTLPVVDESEIEEEFLEEMEKEQLADGSEDEGSTDGESDASILDREDLITQELDEEYRLEYETNVKRSIAIAHELHSPVATLLHPHSHHLANATPGATSLALPQVVDGRTAMSALSLPDDEEELRVGTKYEVSDTELNTFLTGIQCFLAPIFVVLALLGQSMMIFQHYKLRRKCASRKPA